MSQEGEAKIVGGPAVTAQYVVGAPTQGNPANLPVAEPALCGFDWKSATST